MAKLTDAEKDRVSSLANTSVDDMRSSLRCMPGHYSLVVLRGVLAIAKRRGEKTRIRVIEAEIKRLDKEGVK